MDANRLQHPPEFRRHSLSLATNELELDQYLDFLHFFIGYNFDHPETITGGDFHQFTQLFLEFFPNFQERSLIKSARFLRDLTHTDKEGLPLLSHPEFQESVRLLSLIFRPAGLWNEKISYRVYQAALSLVTMEELIEELRKGQDNAVVLQHKFAIEFITLSRCIIKLTKSAYCNPNEQQVKALRKIISRMLNYFAYSISSWIAAPDFLQKVFRVCARVSPKSEDLLTSLFRFIIEHNLLPPE